MSTPRLVHAAVEASRTNGASIGEDPGLLQLSGKLGATALAAWQTVADARDGWSSLQCFDSSDDLVGPGTASDNDFVRLRISFAPVEGAAHIFTVEGWRSFLRDDTATTSVTVVRTAFDGTTFETYGFVVAPWTGPPTAAAIPAWKRENGPRRQVRCQSPLLMAPTAIEPYVAKTRPDATSVCWREWAAIAADQIARSLPDEMYVADGTKMIGLSGQPPRRLELGSFDRAGMPFDDMQAAASWIYLEGKDVEVRHVFLAAELAREWPEGVTFCAGLPGKLKIARQSSDLLYKAHLRSGSKETLKSLADLRKSLVDDVGKLVQQARDLANGVWRDVAVAIGLVAIRYGLDAAKAAAAQPAFACVFLFVALYIGLSFRMATTINNRYLTNSAASRLAFRTKLYGYLDDVDYAALAETPLEDAVKDYRAVERRTLIVVIVVVIGLAYASITEGHDAIKAALAWFEQSAAQLSVQVQPELSLVQDHVVGPRFCSQNSPAVMGRAIGRAPGSEALDSGRGARCAAALNGSDLGDRAGKDDEPAVLRPAVADADVLAGEDREVVEVGSRDENGILDITSKWSEKAATWGSRRLEPVAHGPSRNPSDRR